MADKTAIIRDALARALFDADQAIYDAFPPYRGRWAAEADRPALHAG